MIKKLTIALAGNPNSGKTTVFNALTGGRQHVGNYPGVTVEKKDGTLTYQGDEITVVIKRETNSWHWPIFTAVYTTTVAWVISFIVYQGGRFLGWG